MASVGTMGCTPQSRNYGPGSGGEGGSGSAASASTGASGGGTGGAGGAAMCPPDTDDCDMNGVCETNLLGDVDHCGACDNPCIADVGTSASCVAGKCAYSCGMGFEDCDQDPATACLDLQKDNTNCGACGHDCLGGGCVMGACQPTAVLGPDVLPPGAQILSIAVYNESMYVGLGSGQIFSATLDGATPKAFAMVSGQAVALAVTVNGVYVANDQRITLFDFMGFQKYASQQDGSVRHVAANDVAMVWTSTLGNRVRSAGPTGGNQSTVSLGENQPGSIVLEGNVVRWVNAIGDIRQGSTQGVPAQTVFSGPSNAHHLILDKTTHFWVAGTDIYRGLLGDNAAPLHPAGDSVGGLAADGTYLYWTSSLKGEVWRGTKDGSLPKTLSAAGQANPTEMAVAPLAVYWINQGDGTIMRLAR